MPTPALRTVLVALLVALVAAPAVAAPSLDTLLAETGWEHKGSKTHKDAGLEITIDLKWIGELPCLRGTTMADPAPSVLLGVASDIKAAKSWSSAPLLESRLLGQQGDSVDYYQHLDIPGWTGAKDRYWVLRGRKKQDGDVARFQWERFDWRTPYAALAQELADKHPSAIEPPTNLGEWRFSPKNGQTEVRYYVCSDTGGKLPSALERAAALQTLPDTVADIVIEARKRSK